MISTSNNDFKVSWIYFDAKHLYQTIFFAANITFKAFKIHPFEKSSCKTLKRIIDVLLLFLDNTFTYVIQGFMDLFGHN